MELRIVTGARLPHFPENFEPALAQAAQGAGMGFAPFAKRLVVSLGPRTAMPAAVDPQVHGGPQGFVAGPAQPHLMDRAGLVADGGGAGVTLERLGRLKLLTIVAQFG